MKHKIVIEFETLDDECSIQYMEESIKEISEDMFAQLETLHDDYEIDYKNQTIVVSHPHYMCPKCGDVTCANC